MGCGCGPGETCDDMDNEMLSDADLARFGRESDYGNSCAECGMELYEDAAMCPECGAMQESTAFNLVCVQQIGHSTFLSHLLT